MSTTHALTCAELHWLHGLVVRTAEAGWEEVALKLSRAIAEQSAVRQWGALCFSWRIPLSIERIATKGKSAGKAMTIVLSPTMNQYGSLETWMRARLYHELDVRIMAELHKWPAWKHGGRPRAVRVARYSSHEIDEATVDCAGGKVPVDRLVHAGVLCGDAPADLEREARWEKAKPGQGSLLVEVFEVL